MKYNIPLLLLTTLSLILVSMSVFAKPPYDLVLLFLSVILSLPFFITLKSVLEDESNDNP